MAAGEQGAEVIVSADFCAGNLAGRGRSSRFDAFDFGRVFGLDAAYFKGSLQVQPELFGRPKKAGQSHGGISADTTPFENNVIDPWRGHVQPLG
jgi:hypothetical protein